MRTIAKMGLIRELLAQKRRLAYGVLAVVIFSFVCLSIERYRGKYLLHSYWQEASANGKIADTKQIWPVPIVLSSEWTNVMDSIPRALTNGGFNHPGSPSGGYWGSDTNEIALAWAKSERQLDTIAPLLQSLHALLGDPPRNLGLSLENALEYKTIPNFVGCRVTAQTLGSAIRIDLRRGKHEAAFQHALDLVRLAQVNREDPKLVSVMMRVAILGLGVGSVFGMVAETNLTESQLKSLQTEFQSIDLIPMLEKSMIMERFERLEMYRQIRSQNYTDLIKQIQAMYSAYGVQDQLPEDCTNPLIVAWRNYIFHPLWSYAWSDLEMYHYLKETDPGMDIFHQHALHPNSLKLDLSTRKLTSSSRFSRFYYQISPLDWLSQSLTRDGKRASSTRKSKTYFPGPEQSNLAWLTAFRNITLREILVTAIALRRYELHHAHFPPNLNSLVPEYLPKIPMDLMNGQALVYKVNAPDRYTLYSVGEDGKDDGGDWRPPNWDPVKNPKPHWMSGRDWVWPKELGD